MPMGTEIGENQVVTDPANQQIDNTTNDLQDNPVDVGQVEQNTIDKAENGTLENNQQDPTPQADSGIPIERNLNRDVVGDDAAFVAEAERAPFSTSDSQTTVSEDTGMERSSFQTVDQDRTTEELQEIERLNDALDNNDQSASDVASNDSSSSAVDMPEASGSTVESSQQGSSAQDGIVDVSGVQGETEPEHNYTIETGTNPGDEMPVLPPDDSLDAATFETTPVDFDALTETPDMNYQFNDYENQPIDNATDSSINDYSDYDMGLDASQDAQNAGLDSVQDNPDSLVETGTVPETTTIGEIDTGTTNDAVSTGETQPEESDMHMSGNPEDNESAQITSEGDPVGIENQPAGLDNLDQDTIKSDTDASLPSDEILTPLDTDTSNGSDQATYDTQQDGADSHIEKDEDSSRGNGSSFESTTEAGLTDIVQGIRTDGIDGLSEQMQNMFPDDYTTEGFAETIQDGLSQLESQVDSEDPTIDISRDAIDNAQNDAHDFMQINDLDIQQADVDNNPDPFDTNDQFELDQQNDTSSDYDPAFVEDLDDRDSDGFY